jgi:hypothetical protein
MKSFTKISSRLLLSILLLGGVTASRAGIAPIKPSRTIKQLIERANVLGAEGPLEQEISSNLGFEQPPLVKSFGYSKDQSSDRRAHRFYVVYDEKRKKPVALIWENVFTSTNEAGETIVDGYRFRTTPDGKPTHSLHSHGRAGAVAHDVEDVKTPETQFVYDKERSFFLTEAANLD